jgi:hypothetical protein
VEKEDLPAPKPKRQKKMSKQERLEIKREEDWMVQYRKLIAFKQKYKHANVSLKLKEDPKLGRCVMTRCYLLFNGI